jgi:hypothetical protein
MKHASGQVQKGMFNSKRLIPHCVIMGQILFPLRPAFEYILKGLDSLWLNRNGKFKKEPDVK